MRIIIKTTNIKLTKALEKYIEEKLNSLEKLIKAFQTEKYFNHFFNKEKPGVEAWVEVGKTTFHHQKGPYFQVKCQMRFPKKNLRAVAQRENLESAITKVKKELQRELKQYKEKLKVLTERKARILKNKLRLSG